MASSFSRFLEHTQRRATLGSTPLDEWSASRRDFYLTTQHSQQTNIHATGGIRTHNLTRQAAGDLDRAATGAGKNVEYTLKIRGRYLQVL